MTIYCYQHPHAFDPCDDCESEELERDEEASGGDPPPLPPANCQTVFSSGVVSTSTAATVAHVSSVGRTVMSSSDELMSGRQLGSSSSLFVSVVHSGERGMCAELAPPCQRQNKT
ncbi:hypothetical protein LSTR_LSTR012220 [Laodelphax striatellus]|uniref:Uncharacterized protein n=1 Tax=Laodelphax striatellus TaxID=195883 RepID=A0A482WP26_LAOST|nr:hypothetical protein LSTR_LSTR012220 [Laodelphax striatellus]